MYIKGFINLPELLESCFQISRANLIGIVLLAESKGLWGMNLKKIPIIENKPEKCEDIFHYKYFPEWMNFSIDYMERTIGTIIAFKLDI